MVERNFKMSHLEEAENEPVGQPMGIIILIDALDEIDRAVRWVGETDNVPAKMPSKIVLLSVHKNNHQRRKIIL